ncbi:MULTISPECIES: phage head completion protein [Lacticaseibacillus]|uniref:Head-tail adaptor protein n=2 Tax=Lacticaseibacillus yichunensis TaxID=2486015 RepID=A0ABW4CMI7_9LACO|nr:MULTISPECIES: head-tail adaptor protein [Lacticaseibacillus]
MRTTNMRERITFVSLTPAEVNGVIVPDNPTDQMTVWAEVPKVPLREANDPQTTLGVRTEKPTFIIRFLTDSNIDPSWCIRWHGVLYDITGLDPDYQRRDITTITTAKRKVKPRVS